MFCSFVLQNGGFWGGPDETRTRDLRHARAVMVASGDPPLLVVGEKIRHKYQENSKTLYAGARGCVRAVSDYVGVVISVP